MAHGRSICRAVRTDGSRVHHIISIQFDNVHFTRDNPNVPSDLEQMPHLLNFLRAKGTFSTNHHAVLISHTANDILTTLTGVYGDRHGIPVSNSYVVYDPMENPIPGVSSFFYWTDLVSDVSPPTHDGAFGMVTADGMNAPAPWVPFTRAGCNVGYWSVANTVIERSPFDIAKVFGNPSNELSDPTKATDFEGADVHCAFGDPLCANLTAPARAVADLLPDEPGGYSGFD